MNSNYSDQGKVHLDIMHYAYNYNNKIFKFISKNIDNDINILDFGAGVGEFTNRLSGNKNIYAVEIDQLMHKYISCETYTAIDDIKGNIHFHLIYSSNVLEHIKDDQDIINKFYERLNQKGTLRIFVPAKMILFSRMDEMVGHYRRYEKKELIQLLNNAGFEVTYCHYFDFLGFIISLIYKRMNNNGVISKRSIQLYDKIIFPISYILDRLLFKYIIGKNLIIEAVKT